MSCEESCGRTHIKWTHKGVFQIRRDVSSDMAMMDRRGIELLSSNFSSVVVIVQNSSIARGRQRSGRRKIPKQEHDGCGLEGGGHFPFIIFTVEIENVATCPMVVWFGLANEEWPWDAMQQPRRWWFEWKMKSGSGKWEICGKV